MTTASVHVLPQQKLISVGPGLDCDLDRLLTTKLLIQATSGAGKSWLLRRLLEQTHGHVQQFVIDPEGEFSTLRERFDYVLAARTGGDTVADPRTAKVLAERLLELGVSAILDIYELRPDERRAFVRHFLEAVVDAPKTLWHPVLVVLDEAHVYCPEVGEAESATAVKDLCTRGRKRGFAAVLATQRLSKLHKDAAAECGNKMIGRTSLDVDLQRASNDLGFKSKDQQLALRDLDDGEFYAFGPALTRHVTRVKVGPVATRHPEAGSSLAAVVPAPSAKVKAILAQLADLPAEAEAREKTLEDLQRVNAALKQQLADARNVQPAPVQVEVPVLKDAQLDRLDEAIHRVWDSEKRMARVLSEVYEPVRACVSDLIIALNTKPPQAPPAVIRDRASLAPVSHVPPAARPTPPAPARQAAGGVQAFKRCERAILSVLATHGPCLKGKLALLAGYPYNGSFRTALSNLRTAQAIAGGNEERMELTAVGKSVATYEPLPTGQARIDFWLSKFKRCERAILEALVKHPRGLSADQLAQATGYPYNGSFRTALSNLRTAGVVVGKNTDVMRAHEDLLS